ncbi:MAG: hypothetical protein ACI9QQ_002481, partial [Myxococcota bacterium]
LEMRIEGAELFDLGSRDSVTLTEGDQIRFGQEAPLALKFK